MRAEDKVMNNGKLQAKQEKLKSLHCPSPQSSLFISRDSSLSSRLSSLISHSPVPNPDQSAKSPSFSSQHNSKCAIPSPQNSDESAIRCSQLSSECLTRCLQHNDELATPSPQHLFIDVSTELLHRGQSVRFRAPGLSMHPAIKEGETITVAPISSFDIKRGDILLYIVGRKVIAHRVVRIKREKNDSKSHSSTNFRIQSTSHSPARSPTRPSTLSPRHLFILRGDASAIYDDPVQAHQVLGKVVSVERSGRSIDLYSRKARMLRISYVWASCLKRRMVRLFMGMKTFRRRQLS
jgi:signal peptidase I